MRKGLLICFSLLLCYGYSRAQYTVNGSATRDNCHCYTLTRDVLTQSGSVWNNNRINLTQSFNFVFDVFLGCNDGGADGIAFVLQPISTSVGGTGSGLGYGGISPAVGVTLDTYQNGSPDNDPFYDHIALQLNGDMNHLSPNTLTPLIPISATNNNVEDCNTHSLRIIWDAPGFTLTVLFDGQLRFSITRDFINTVFGGNSQVFWGFTGSTGGLSNLQRFCTALIPGINLQPVQNRCVNEPINFFDNTVSFGGILKRYWNFGDGSPIDSVNVNPVHTYTAAGNYIVTLTVMGVDSCVETIPQNLRIGSKPVAGFYVQDTCFNMTTRFTDTSRVTVGTLNSIYWNLDNGGASSTLSNPTTVYTTPGIKNIKLVVKSLEGCASDTLYKPIRIRERPVVDFRFTDSVCLGNAMSFTDNSTLAGGPVNGWIWYIDGVNAGNNNATLTHTFTTPGNHSVGLISSSTGSPDCMGNLLFKNVFVVDKPRAALRAIFICEGMPVQLQDSSYTLDGLPITRWWWDLGNGQFSTLQNPLVSYPTAGPAVIRGVVFNSRNCPSDTLVYPVSIGARPVAGFGYSNPLCEGMPVQFSDSSTVAGSVTNAWSWTESGNQWSALQNPVQLFSAGAHTIGLQVTSSQGCTSERVDKTISIAYKPAIQWQFGDTCKNALVSFTASDSLPGSVSEWHWDFGDGSRGSGNSTSHVYRANGTYTVQLYGTSFIGCPNTTTLSGPIHIYGINAFAGTDIIAAEMQPVQLNATGGLSYEWSPAGGLSATNIPNPVATVGSDTRYYLKAFTPGGCESYDTLLVKIYKGPDIYLPTAFTPNDDGLNDIFRGIPVGIKVFNFLKVYNRWGQEVFSSTDHGKGWNGQWKGRGQDSGVYVVVASGIDFTGKPIFKKGTVLLIR